MASEAAALLAAKKKSLDVAIITVALWEFKFNSARVCMCACVCARSAVCVCLCKCVRNTPKALSDVNCTTRTTRKDDL